MSPVNEHTVRVNVQGEPRFYGSGEEKYNCKIEDIGSLTSLFSYINLCGVKTVYCYCYTLRYSLQALIGSKLMSSTLRKH